MGAEVQRSYNSQGHTATIAANTQLQNHDMAIPGDISSAAFLIAAGLLVPGSDIRIRGVGVNHTRTGLLDVLAKLGAPLPIVEQRDVGGEPVGTLHVKPSALRTPGEGTPLVVAGDLIPRLIDELVVFAAVMAQTHGTVEVREARELLV
jgi:3-phosphoshikimate 1-carboxyvinyltransferase